MVWLLVLFFVDGLLSTHAIDFLAAVILLSCCIALCDVYLSILDLQDQNDLFLFLLALLLLCCSILVPLLLYLLFANLNQLSLEQVSKFIYGS